MNYAIIAVTANGALLAQKLSSKLEEHTVVYCKDRYNKYPYFVPFKQMSSIMAKLFADFDALIFLCATGIAVRMIAPYVVRKDKDPAVVVVDEQGHYAVSLLSGHLGGANELAKEVAAILQSVPVITTATDSNGLMAPDSIARASGFIVWPLANVKVVNAALLAGKKISYYIDKDCFASTQLVPIFKRYGIEAEMIAKDDLENKVKPCVFITDEQIEAAGVLCFLHHELIAGIGCRRGVEASNIEACLQKACTMIGYDIKEVVQLASTKVKENEAGILQTAQKYKIPVRFLGNTALQKCVDEYGLKESAFVKEHIGVGNVCEAAALAGGRRELVLNKTKFEKVTVALAWEK